VKVAVAFAALVLASATPASAQPAMCRVLDLKFQPAAVGDSSDRFAPQIVAWLETADGTFVDTIYITHATGTYGLGNRPGRFDFNSSAFWPYGRRVQTFPVWSMRQPMRWPQLVFQDGDDDDLSHAGSKSSRELYYCRPLHNPDELDAISCPSDLSYTDKGMFSATQSRYPPRNDLNLLPQDDPSVEMFGMMNPFDAISQPTPQVGNTTVVTWAVPSTVPNGDYVLWMEVSKEFDMNGTYNPTTFPAPTGIPWSDYGTPYRGQPSVVYRVPFQLALGAGGGVVSAYEGYGDPDGIDGAIRQPDATIETRPGSGAGRLALLSDNGETYRLRVTSYIENDETPPDEPAKITQTEVLANRATITFEAPGDDRDEGMVTGYEIRYRVREPITEENFDSSTQIAAVLAPVPAGELQTFTFEGLIPETTYHVGIRAFDNCQNKSELVTFEVTTPERPMGEVDACFVATAAYGSSMAGDVEMLRRFRDTLLAKTVFGELAVQAYYTLGPALSGLIGESEVLRSTARSALDPIVSKVREYKH
jgi:hypothetical protein